MQIAKNILQPPDGHERHRQMDRDTETETDKETERETLCDGVAQLPTNGHSTEGADLADR